MLLGPKENVKPYTVESIFQFGKYKGKTVEEVTNENPEYLLWCVKNIEWFDLDDETRKCAQKKINCLRENRYQRQEAWAHGCFSKASWPEEWDNGEYESEFHS